MLAIQAGDTVVDATLGGAGHAREIHARIGAHGKLIAFDADADAITRAHGQFGNDMNVVLVNSNFRTLRAELESRNIASIDRALFDLGWSAYQLTGGRGFSFQSDEPLSMAYDASQRLTAREAVNEWGVSSLEDVLRGFGEERYARRIAQAISEEREQRPIETARQLADVVKAAVPAAYRYGRIHPATKTFQALRIAVNDELGALADGLNGAWQLLKKDGRIGVITFHSIEDRLVKRTFVGWEKEGTGVRITKKPIVPSAEELRENPRARSAKLRVIQKI